MPFRMNIEKVMLNSTNSTKESLSPRRNNKGCHSREWFRATEKNYPRGRKRNIAPQPYHWSYGSCLKFLSNIRFSHRSDRRLFIECCLPTLSRFPQVNLFTRKSSCDFKGVCTRGDSKIWPIPGSRITSYTTGATHVHIDLLYSPE